MKKYNLSVIVNMAMSGGISELRVDTTPELAADLLELNGSNRNLRVRVWEKYARDMQSGRWVYTGDPIRISESSRLIDGQHRLTAIVKSGVTVPLLFVMGVADLAQSAIDIGPGRLASDSLSMRGMKYAVNGTAIIRRLLSYEAGRKSIRSFVPSNAEIIDYGVEHAVDVERAAAVATAARSQLPATPSVLGALFYVCARVDAEAAERFWVSHVVESDNVGPGHPAKALRKTISYRSARKIRMTDDELFRLGIAAWNAWREGRSVKVLTAAKGPMPTPK